MATNETKCPACGSLSNKNAKFCMKCGNELPKFWVCSKCGEKSALEVERCTKCDIPRYTIWEGAWDCPYCGRTRNRGPEKFCGGCGIPRGGDVKFYLPEDARLVKDEEELARAKAGPDWKCEYCGADNHTDKEFCSGCGAPKDGAPVRKVIEYKFDETKEGKKIDYTLKLTGTGFAVEAMGQIFEGKTADEAFNKFFEHLRESEKLVKERSYPEPPIKAPQSTSHQKQSPVTKALFFGCFSLIFFFILFAIYMIIPRRTSGTVNGFHWQTSIDLERLNTLTETKWEYEVPNDARIMSRRREIHHYNKVQIGTTTKSKTVTEKIKTGTKKVKVGTRDKGNGYFEDVYEDRPIYKEVEKKVTYQEPVYRDVPEYRYKVTYQIDRWQIVGTRSDSGDDQNASVPELKPGYKERKGKISEEFTVFFEGPKKKKLTYKTRNKEEWLTFRIGQKYELKADLHGNVTKIERAK